MPTSGDATPTLPPLPTSAAAAAPAADDAALDTKRKAIIAAIAAARLAAVEAAAASMESSKSQRKVKAEDLFGGDAASKEDTHAENAKDKSYRMQGEYGAKKFIKP